jgi:hypothetical protein
MTTYTIATKNPSSPKQLLTVLSEALGILSVIGTAVTFIPGLAGFDWVTIPFAVTGAILGILSIFMRPEGWTRRSVIGTTFSMAACITGLIRLL